MIHLIYASRAVTPMSDGALADLLRQSRELNQRAQITGLLLSVADSFMQVLEGSDAAVQETYARIERDPRHRDLRLLVVEPIADRQFPDWSMGFEHPDDQLLARVLPGYLAPQTAPLVDPAVVPHAAVAEYLLLQYAGRGLAGGV
ncbi:MAG: BLUF domain-containing protein [Frankiaceae bacterium]|nr:BLUF domain-containing protein [Frankiaceae bacterium]MBV9871726.1 BLUF domain-containing protein [Frankiaceae bacterium]